LNLLKTASPRLPGRDSRPTGFPVELQLLDRSGLELKLLTNILLPVTHRRFRLYVYRLENISPKTLLPRA